MLSYSWIWLSHGKLWWKSVIDLTCKSIFKFGFRGERPIETSSSWFSPKFPPGKLMLLQLYRIKRMIRGLERIAILNYFQTLNIYTTTCYLRKLVETMEISNGLCFGKQDWRWGMNLPLIQIVEVITHQILERVLVHTDSGMMVMEVEIRQGVCNNSPTEWCSPENGFRWSESTKINRLNTNEKRSL